MAKPQQVYVKSRRTGVSEDNRKKLIVAVRAACRRLGIDDDTRKAIQTEKIGKASMSDMTLPELGQMLDHLNRDWKGPMGHRAHLGKVKALWWTLYWLGEVQACDEGAISSFVTRQTKIANLRFLDHKSAPAVIEALKAWATRVGVDWPTAADIDQEAQYTPGYCALQADRHAVLNALATRLHKMGVLLDSHYANYVSRALGLGLAFPRWTPVELDAGIRMLGKMHRRALEKEAQ